MFLLIDLLPILLFGLVLCGKGHKRLGRKELNPDYLSIESSRSIRGFFTIAVVFHHLAQHTTDGLLFRFFALVGYFAVSVFFFLSGYGLQSRHLHDKNYKHGFMARRLLPILLPYTLITLIYWLTYALLGTRYTLWDVLVGLVDGKPIAMFSWYIISIIVFYVVFYLLMRLCKERYLLMLLGASIYCLLYIIICVKLDYGSWWYNAVHILVLGMAWAVYENRIVTLIKKNYRLTFLLACVILPSVLHFTGNRFGLTNIRGVLDVLVGLKAATFVLSIIVCSLKFTRSNAVLNYLGEISLEIYLCHGLFIAALRSNVMYVQSDFVYATLVVLCSVTFAHVFHAGNRWLVEQCKSKRQADIRD